MTDPSQHEGTGSSDLDPVRDTYKWVALSNTSLGSFMAALDSSIVIVSLPAIFRGIGLDPLDPRNISYLLWMIMGYLVVSAVLVVTVGRLGDMYGRVRIYNLGFVIFTIASIALSVDPFESGAGALWLIIGRIVQAVGGSMLLANSAAILTDAFPTHQRGTALGFNQVSALTGQSVGLVAGGLLAAWDWRAVFWVNVPFGIFGTVWAYLSLKESAARKPERIDWLGNTTFALGASLILASISYGVQPYGRHTMGWWSPWVVSGLLGGVALLVAFIRIESRVEHPMFDLALFRIRTFAIGGFANFLAAIARGGLQLVLIIWLQGIWLPLHGIEYEDTPMWAGIALLPMTLGILIAGPLCGFLSDRFGSTKLATSGLAVFATSLVGLILIPVVFPYWAFMLLIALNGIGSGMFAAPNTSAMMGSVPNHQRGSASGMRQTLQNSGMSLAIGFFFCLLTAGLATSLPSTVSKGLQEHGVSATVADDAAHLPPVSTVFAAFLGENPTRHLLEPSGALEEIPPADAEVLTGTSFFPRLISAPFHNGLNTVFGVAALLAYVASAASWISGRRRVIK